MNLKTVGIALLVVGAVVVLTDTKIKIRPSAVIPDVTINTK